MPGNLERAQIAEHLGLTPQQFAVAELTAEGKLNKQIAYELGLTPGTITQYLNRIYARKNIHTRAELASWFIRQTEVRPSHLRGLLCRVGRTWPVQSKSRSASTSVG